MGDALQTAAELLYDATHEQLSLPFVSPSSYAIQHSLAYCNPILNANTWTVTGDTDRKTNFDEERFGHAKYECLEAMLLDYQQYEKAISYAWCVLPHCSERCPEEGWMGGGAGAAAECPTTHWEIPNKDGCESAVYNLLGFCSSKVRAPPDGRRG